MILRHGYEQDKTFDVFAGRTQFESVRIFTVFTANFVFYPVLSGVFRVLPKKNKSNSKLFIPVICWSFGKGTHQITRPDSVVPSRFLSIVPSEAAVLLIFTSRLER